MESSFAQVTVPPGDTRTSGGLNRASTIDTRPSAAWTGAGVIQKQRRAAKARRRMPKGYLPPVPSPAFGRPQVTPLFSHREFSARRLAAAKDDLGLTASLCIP